MDWVCIKIIGVHFFFMSYIKHIFYTTVVIATAPTIRVPLTRKASLVMALHIYDLTGTSAVRDTGPRTGPTSSLRLENKVQVPGSKYSSTSKN